MYQTLARILGTMVLTYLNQKHLLGSRFNLTPEETAYVGDAIIFVAVSAWAYLDKLSKGHITPTGQSVILSNASSDSAFELPFRSSSPESLISGHAIMNESNISHQSSPPAVRPIDLNEK